MMSQPQTDVLYQQVLADLAKDYLAKSVLAMTLAAINDNDAASSSIRFLKQPYFNMVIAKLKGKLVNLIWDVLRQSYQFLNINDASERYLRGIQLIEIPIELYQKIHYYRRDC